MTTDPTTIQPTVYWDSEVIYMPHWQRFNGTTLEPLVNSAGGLFPKPIVQQVAIAVCHIIQWKTFTDANRKEQLNATNNGTWHNWEAGQAWISRIIDEDEETNQVNTKLVHYVVRCNEFGWDNQFPQMGYFHGTTTKNSFQTADGVPYIGLLDAAGAESNTAVISDDTLKRQIDFTAALGY